MSQWKRQLLDAASELFIRCKQTKDKDEGLDQVRSTDITYIPMRKGFLYLVAIVDLFFRNILSWKLPPSAICCRPLTCPACHSGAVLGANGDIHAIEHHQTHAIRPRQGL